MIVKEVVGQVSGHCDVSRETVCKTVGLAYVGLNPTPATIKLAGQARSSGPRSHVSAGAVCEPLWAGGIDS